MVLLARPAFAQGDRPDYVQLNDNVPLTYTVKKGDTLYRISRRYNLSVEQLRQYNQLDQKASIYPGQKLKVSSPQ